METKKPEAPLGKYRDPESGVSAIAIAEPQADAFVHMGWKLVEETTETTSKVEDKKKSEK